MEINDSIIEGAMQRHRAVNPDGRIVKSGETNSAGVTISAEMVGQNNVTRLRDGEFAQFLKEYKPEDEGKTWFIEERESATTGLPYYRLYALVTRFYKAGNKHVAENASFIDVGNLVQMHFDLGDQALGEDGYVKSAVRVVDDTPFNKELASYRIPAAMLQFLAGKTLTAKRTDKKYFYQKFVDRHPVSDHYQEGFSMELSKVNG